MYEIGSGYGEAFGFSRKRSGALSGQIEEVGGAHGEVGEDFEVPDAVGAKLEGG